MMPKRITWERSTGVGRSGWTGTVGKRQLFSIEMSVHRDTGWVLRTRLPFGLVPGKAIGKDEIAIMSYAERVLNTFVTSLGASFDD